MHRIVASRLFDYAVNLLMRHSAVSYWVLARGVGEVNHRQVVYVPKFQAGDKAPWQTFGCDEAEYRKWVPHSCGICCLKMVGDTVGATREQTLYALTIKCLALGGFRIEGDGSIRGVFHYPLLELARTLGMSGLVAGNLDSNTLVAAVTSGRYVMLSIDSSKVCSQAAGGHLVLVYGYDAAPDLLLLHDCAAIFDGGGENVRVTRAELEKVSNKRGIVVW